MIATRALIIITASVATVVAVIALLLVPLSITVGRYANVLIEIAVLAACTYYVALVMRADRRARAAREAALPAERRRPAGRVPRRPITFQLRETAVLFVVWFVAVFAFDALSADLEPAVNAGISVFAAFLLATLTVTGRHMMFRLTAEEHDAERER